MVRGERGCQPLVERVGEAVLAQVDVAGVFDLVDQGVFLGAWTGSTSTRWASWERRLWRRSTPCATRPLDAAGLARLRDLATSVQSVRIQQQQIEQAALQVASELDDLDVVVHSDAEAPTASRVPKRPALLGDLFGVPEAVSDALRRR